MKRHILKHLKTNTRRFFKTEDRILRVYNEELNNTKGLRHIHFKSIFRRMKLGHDGPYYHYRSEEDVIGDNYEFIRKVLRDLINEAETQEYDARAFIFKLTIAIYQDGIRFEIEQSRRSFLIWEYFFPAARKLLTKGWTSYGKAIDDMIYRYYCGEFVIAMYAWGKHGYDKENQQKCLDRLIWLTKNAVRMWKDAI